MAAVAFIDSVDRGILPGVLELVQKDLHFSDTQAGLLASVFVLMSFVVAIPAGYIADRFRRTYIIGIALASWGVITAANAVVRNFGQFLAVRAVLGAGEAVNGPASNSLLADYYEPSIRGRAYAYTRVAPTVGYAIGLGVGGAVGSLWGWRAAFLIVGVPGSLLAFWMLRVREPVRGESDKTDTSDTLLESAVRRGWTALREDLREAIRVRSLRAVMIGTAVSTGALTGLGFWAASFYERHTSLGVGASAKLVGAIILLGAIVGTLLGGRAADRARVAEASSPMRLAGVTQLIAGVVLAATFLHMPLWARLPGQLVGVAFVVAAFPALSAMTSEVVAPNIRGSAFALIGFLSALSSAISPLVIGIVADAFPITIHGHREGNLATAFLVVTPLIGIGAIIVLNGRRHVADDIARVKAAEQQETT
ncbi:MAG: MFS transporter [Actinobacteria bacterium]|nr:MFS transporter [Actinomycetota bacterium]